MELDFDQIPPDPLDSIPPDPLDTNRNIASGSAGSFRQSRNLKSINADPSHKSAEEKDRALADALGVNYDVASKSKHYYPGLFSALSINEGGFQDELGKSRGGRMLQSGLAPIQGAMGLIGGLSSRLGKKIGLTTDSDIELGNFINNAWSRNRKESSQPREFERLETAGSPLETGAEIAGSLLLPVKGKYPTSSGAAIGASQPSDAFGTDLWPYIQSKLPGAAIGAWAGFLTGAASASATRRLAAADPNSLAGKVANKLGFTENPNPAITPEVMRSRYAKGIPKLGGGNAVKNAFNKTLEDTKALDRAGYDTAKAAGGTDILPMDDIAKALEQYDIAIKDLSTKLTPDNTAVKTLIDQRNRLAGEMTQPIEQVAGRESRTIMGKDSYGVDQPRTIEVDTMVDVPKGNPINVSPLDETGGRTFGGFIDHYKGINAQMQNAYNTAEGAPSLRAAGSADVGNAVYNIKHKGFIPAMENNPGYSDFLAAKAFHEDNVVPWRQGFADKILNSDSPEAMTRRYVGSPTRDMVDQTTFGNLGGPWVSNEAQAGGRAVALDLVSDRAATGPGGYRILGTPQGGLRPGVEKLFPGEGVGTAGGDMTSMLKVAKAAEFLGNFTGLKIPGLSAQSGKMWQGILRDPGLRRIFTLSANLPENSPWQQKFAEIVAPKLAAAFSPDNTSNPVDERVIHDDPLR